ncbi:LysR family transcriptional regulator [Nocardioides marmoriginsengisoli]|uniref:LysR family transcriptional regulator n=1 Tax=Nocardioides marmoriginsengisoli TaxID=661483 RepID=A0A3N0C943_9ACTN|nr:LysR substrate-binding domain-containing protein [Nocardioides marmoriginsengisoli]RNL59998.1 LysR family transcriptional regulator [Nocardioides marmoriginsengisoli]
MEQITPWRVGFVPGVTPGKWERSWTEHERASRRWRRLEVVPVALEDQERAIRAGEVDMCLVRGPVDRDGMHYVALYDEVPVVVVAREHPVTAYDEVALADLAGELDVLAEFPELDLPMAIETVAAGSGYVIVPMSLARLHGRKDVEHRPVTDGEESPIGLAWLVANEDPDTQGFVGIVRGRTPRSSR